MRHYTILALCVMVWGASSGSEVDLGPWSVDEQGSLSGEDMNLSAVVYRDERQVLLSVEALNRQVLQLRYELKDEEHHLRRLVHFDRQMNALVLVDTFSGPEKQNVTFAQQVGTHSRSYRSLEMVRGDQATNTNRERHQGTEGARLAIHTDNVFALQWVVGSQRNSLQREIRYLSGGLEAQWQKPQGRSAITVVTVVAGVGGNWGEMLALVRGHRLPDRLGFPDEVLVNLDNYPLAFPDSSADSGQAAAVAESWHAPTPHAWPAAREQDQLLFRGGGSVHGEAKPGQSLRIIPAAGGDDQQVSLDAIRGLLALGQGRLLARLIDGSQRIYQVSEDSTILIDTDHGQMRWQPFAAQAGTVWRRAADDFDLVSLDGKVLELEDGRVLAVQPPPETLRLASPWGVLDVEWDSILRLQRRDDQGRYWFCRLDDGSQLPIFAGAQEWVFTDLLTDQKVRIISDQVLNYRSGGGSDLLQLAADARLPTLLRRDGILTTHVGHDEPLEEAGEQGEPASAVDSADEGPIQETDEEEASVAVESPSSDENDTSSPEPGTFAALLADFAQESGLALQLASDSTFYAGLTTELSISGFDARSRLESILRQTGLTAVIYQDGSVQIHDPQRLDPTSAARGDGDTISLGEDWLLKGALQDLQMLTHDGQKLQASGLISLIREGEGLLMRHRDHPSQAVQLLGRQVRLRHPGGLLICPEGHLSSIVPASGDQP